MNQFLCLQPFKTTIIFPIFYLLQEHNERPLATSGSLKCLFEDVLGVTLFFLPSSLAVGDSKTQKPVQIKFFFSYFFFIVQIRITYVMWNYYYVSLIHNGSCGLQKLIENGLGGKCYHDLYIKLKSFVVWRLDLASMTNKYLRFTLLPQISIIFLNVQLCFPYMVSIGRQLL